MIADSHCYVVVDCEQPSYIKSNRQLVMLSNHILNDHLKRKQDPLYNETDAYICDKTENVWRVNPAVFSGLSGFIGFIIDTFDGNSVKNVIILIFNLKF